MLGNGGFAWNCGACTYYWNNMTNFKKFYGKHENRI